jgi:hypothetical protein
MDEHQGTSRFNLLAFYGGTLSQSSRVVDMIIHNMARIKRNPFPQNISENLENGDSSPTRPIAQSSQRDPQQPNSQPFPFVCWLAC